MRPKVLLVVMIPLIVALVLFREARLAQRLETLSKENDQLVAERDVTVTRLIGLETRLNELEVETGTTASTRNDSPLQQALDRMAALETRLQNNSRGSSGPVPWLPSVPEYDPTKPPAPADLTPALTNAVAKRAWGPEQITGPPDTHQAGDVATAWASREPDGGAEWLWAEFDRPVELSQIRIRETFNPGAITKVTAALNGQQIVLWEGTAATGQAPRDFVVNPPSGINTRSVVVHFDTARVPGWNEVDAIELIGKDSSHQWATAVNASSSFADSNGNAEPAGVLDEHNLTDPGTREQ